MLTPHETLTPHYTIEEPLRFVNIIARRTFSHTSLDRLDEIKQLIAKQWKYNPNKPIDAIIINKILVNSVCFN